MPTAAGADSFTFDTVLNTQKQLNQTRHISSHIGSVHIFKKLPTA